MSHCSTGNTQDLILRLLKHYEKDSIRAALLQHWARINEIPFSRLKQANSVAHFLEPSNLIEVERIRQKLNQSIFELSIKDIESIFEILIDSGRRKSQGAFYTPDFIIKYLIRHGLQISQYKEKNKKHRSSAIPLVEAVGF